MDNKQAAPKTIKEVGIHLVYMSNDMASIKKQLENMSNNFTTKQELLNAIERRKIEQQQFIDEITCIDKRVIVVEKVISGITNRIAAISLTMLALMILAQYGLDKFLRG